MTTFEQYLNLYLVVCGGIVNILAAVLVLWWWLTDDEIPKQMPDEYEQTDKVRG